MIRNKIYILLPILTAIVIVSPLLFADDSKENIFNSEKAIAVDAQIIAHRKLAKNINDPLALTLVDFAHHLHSTYEPLLLLRGKLKYNLEIKPPNQKGVSEEEFIFNLKKRAKNLTRLII